MHIKIKVLYILVSIGIAAGLSVLYYIAFLLPRQLVFENQQRLHTVIRVELNAFQQWQVSEQSLRSLDPSSAGFNLARKNLISKIRSNEVTYQTLVNKNQQLANRSPEWSRTQQEARTLISISGKRLNAISNLDHKLANLYEYNPYLDLDENSPEQMIVRLTRASEGLRKIAATLPARSSVALTISRGADSLQTIKNFAAQDPGTARKESILTIDDLKNASYSQELSLLPEIPREQAKNITRNYRSLLSYPLGTMSTEGRLFLKFGNAAEGPVLYTKVFEDRAS